MSKHTHEPKDDDKDAKPKTDPKPAYDGDTGGGSGDGGSGDGGDGGNPPGGSPGPG